MICLFVDFCWEGEKDTKDKRGQKRKYFSIFENQSISLKINMSVFFFTIKFKKK